MVMECKSYAQSCCSFHDDQTDEGPKGDFVKQMGEREVLLEECVIKFQRNNT